MKKLVTPLFIAMIWSVANAQPTTTLQLADSARLFGPGIISTGDFEFDPAFSPDGKTVYFAKSTIDFGYMAIFSSTREGSLWSAPKAVNFTGVYRDTDPFVSADGKRLYFSSDRPVDEKDRSEHDNRCFYVGLKDNAIVTAPKLLDLPIPDGMRVSYPSFASNGDIFFFSIDKGDADIYVCPFKDERYQPPVKLSFNSDKYFDFDPFVASDESFIVFTSNNRQGYGSGDLWVSFNKSGNWTEPVNLGPKVNTKGNDVAPSLSRDNKTLYFDSYRELEPRPVYKDGKPTTESILALLHSYRNGVRNIYEINISDLAGHAI